ncbi:S-layer homology domain-containing protein [Candidatus Peregrinibacteria bacterium]|nr:MAG: S-layer homology domain-containing protein [Candidatus Peregrinibacteria bacterium]
MNPHATPRSTRLIVLAILFTLFASFLPMVRVTEALSIIGRAQLELSGNPGGGLNEIRSVSPVETRYDLVVILVDEEIWSSSSSGSGFFSFLGTAALNEKIQRYAEDVQSALPWTKSMIVTVSPGDSTVDIQRFLEKLYFEGNAEDSDATRLAGVVAVGQVPLPVVNKNGYRFVSLLPYTDFEEPAYIVDEASQDFVLNTGAQNLQAEVWHGVLVPPLGGQDGVDLLAAYFDKNHAFHSGEEEYIRFDEKVFIADFVTESHTLNSVAYGAYERYTNLWEDLAYYRYTNDLIEEVFTEMQSTVNSGDMLDNDFDGNYDEEASNNMDDDGDGLVDEDLGDGFFGIDNDGDGLVDEDGSADNNNDEDHLTDEDPPGDANADGCAGYCGKDDNGDASDSDGDGYPNGLETVLGTDPADESEPWKSVLTFSNAEPYSFNFSTADEATDYWAAAFTDQFFAGNGLDSSCYSNGAYHPEWDDDEDGFCDEDGSIEMPAGAFCAYNDADCDGTVDEDTQGLQPRALFENLPDLQSKKLLEGLTKKYVELFSEPQGVWNRVVRGTGRYEAQALDSNERALSDYDTPISLISKKDEYTLEYLRAVNDTLESLTNDLVNEELARQIPVIGMMELSGTYTAEEEDSEAQAICTAGEAADLTSDACLQFFNSGSSDGVFDSVDLPHNSMAEYVSSNDADKIYMNGTALTDIDSPAACTLFAGTYEEDGQLSQFNAMYSTDQLDLNVNEVQDYKNCVPEFASYLDEIPELCSVATATEDIRNLGGAISADELAERIGQTPEEAASNWEVGPEACYEFREFTTYSVYLQSNGRFNDWLSKKLRKFQKDSGRDESEYEEFLERVQERREEWGPDTVTLRKHFRELDLISSSTEITYTVTDMMNDVLGYREEWNDDDIDTYLALHDEDTPIVIQNPEYGSGTEDLANITVYLNKAYLREDSESFTLDEEEAEMISSSYYHNEPNSATLNAQAATLASPNLPIDATRRVVFIDEADESQTLNYVNAFDASTVSDVQNQLDILAAAVANVSEGSTHANDVENFMDALNVHQLEDALTWYRLSIDEKHDYVLSHYLGSEEPVISKARNGYEVVSIIADGKADEMVAAFHPVDEQESDLEFIYRDLELAEAALSEDQAPSQPEPLSALSNTTPVNLWEWFPAVETWLGELRNSVNNFGTYGGGAVCGDASDFVQENGDEDGNGIPDGAEATLRLTLSSEDYSVLEAYGLNGDTYVVSVSARQADDSLNALDNNTEILLQVVSGTASAEILGSSILQLSGGVASFSIGGLEPGTFTLQASASNRENVTNSNLLSGTVEEKHLKVSTFIRENADGTVQENHSGQRIEVRNENGEVVAVLNPENGDLELRGVQAKLLEATPNLPTRVSIQDSEGRTYGVFFLIPEVKTVAIGDGYAGVFVETLDSSHEALPTDAGVGLFKDTLQMGLVTDHGQIAVSEGYRLEFENPSEINLYEPLYITNSAGERFFKVSIKHSIQQGSLVEPTGLYENHLSLKHKTWFKRALAALVIPDYDADGLDDLEEWVIGTETNLSDTDEDGYLDGTEIFSGYSPLEEEEKLFTDIDGSHEAYYALATLYLRGIVKGYSDGTFRPDNPITREEFIKIDLGAICKDCDSYESAYEEALMALYNQDPFPDENISSELLACVAEAKTSGIVSGYAGGEEAGFFLPNRQISVAEATKVLVETAGFESRTPTSNEAWYVGYVEAAQEHDLFPTNQALTREWLEGSITRAEFVMMAVNLVEAQDCRAVDNDADYLSDVEETVLYGTNPQNADTDLGGVSDFDEIVRSSDPLNAEDDFPADTSDQEQEDYSAYSSFEHEAGLYSVSSNDAYESITVNAESDSSAPNVYTNTIPADGEATLYVRAEITNLEGSIYVDDNSSIVEFVLSSSEHGRLDSNLIQVQGGVAEAVFNASQNAGELHVSAQVREGALPYEGQTIEVYAGQPTSMNLALESTVLPMGGQSVTEATLTLYDRFGNVANYETYSVTLDSNEVTLLDLTDEDNETPGYQIRIQNGTQAFRVLSSVEASTGTIMAALTEQPDIQDNIELNSVEGLNVNVSLSAPYLFAGSEGTQEVLITVTDAEGTLQTGFQGEVSMSTSDPNHGHFDEPTFSLSEGSAAVTLTAGTLAGNGAVLVESAGLQTGSANLEVKPAEIYELRIRKDDGAMRAQAGELEYFWVEGYDVYGNRVTTDSTTTGTLRLTEASADYATLSSAIFQLNQGADRFGVQVGEVSGRLSIVASAPALLAGTWGGNIEYFTTGEELSGMQPQMLYANVLGAPFGNVNEENYVAGWLLFNEKLKPSAVWFLSQNPINLWLLWMLKETSHWPKMDCSLKSWKAQQ